MNFEKETLSSKVGESENSEFETSPFQKLMYGLREKGVRVSTSEWLDLQKLMDAGEVHDVDELYEIARMVLVKDATDYPVYDRVFGKLFLGLEIIDEVEEEIEDDEQPLDEEEPEQKEKEDITEVA